MTEDKEYEGKGLRGPLYWLAGIQTLSAAKQALGPGGLAGLFGAPMPPPGGPGAPVSREVADLMVENATLKANAHADGQNAVQMAWNARQEERMNCQQRQLDQLFGLTRLTVPNANLNPGYGPAIVAPAPVPVVPGTPDAATIAAIVTAVLDAQAASAKSAA